MESGGYAVEAGKAGKIGEATENGEPGVVCVICILACLYHVHTCLLYLACLFTQAYRPDLTYLRFDCLCSPLDTSAAITVASSFAELQTQHCVAFS